MPTDPRDVVEHLRYYADLGVEGFSRDRAWRARASAAARAAAVTPDPGAEPAPPSRAPHVTPLARSRVEALATVRTDLGECTRCKLHKGRIKLVFGTGNAEARLMFVGEGPGADEDLKGEPFVGRAGQLLTDIITKGMGLKREDVYICNVVKCRPPENRNPEPDEVAACEPFLKKQIDIIGPDIIVGLGKFAVQTLLNSKVPISKLRGIWASYHGIQLMPTFHPAYLLRNPADKKLVWEDIKQVIKVMRGENA